MLNITQPATAVAYSEFCTCPTPKLDATDTCRKCGTQWVVLERWETVVVPEGEDELFKRTGEDEYTCTACDATDTIQAQSYPSMYAGEDRSLTCTNCGSYEKTADPFKGTVKIARKKK